MNQEEVDEFDSSNLDSQIEFLCDRADNLDSVSENWKVEEANLESDNSTREKLDGETAKSDMSDASSNLTTDLLDDHQETEEKSDASPNGQGGSSSKVRFLFFPYLICTCLMLVSIATAACLISLTRNWKCRKKIHHNLNT